VAGDLYKAVLAPVQSLIPAGSDVIVVPDGALYQLDFETLVAPDPQPHYWIEDAYVSTAPSLRVLATHARTEGLAPRLLVIGDPVPTSDFPRLPHAGDEIAIVQKYFPAGNRIVWTGPDATPGRYAEAGPGRFSTIHFAAHASADKERPLRSSIILSRQLSSQLSDQGSDFRLYASDVAGLPLRADLVTISACNSAGGQTYSGEGLVGFAWAFLQAGAWNVIASLWDVDDATSVQIMDRMYAAIAAGQPPARALREAKRAVMASGRRHRAPYFWAALQVYTRRL
jgi:CHAT domain-containing protein